ncbi:MAG: hypothetical protein AAF827_22695 [Cyanobacteria bacterium P01_D01_bin.6]
MAICHQALSHNHPKSHPSTAEARSRWRKRDRAGEIDCVWLSVGCIDSPQIG